MQFSEIKLLRQMKKEADVKENVKRILNYFGPKVWWFMPSMNGYGKQGVPDFVCSVHGFFVALETKFGSNKTTAMQEREIGRINTSGGYAVVITENDLEWLFDELSKIVISEIPCAGTA
jgi:hypothetical protein